MKTFFPSVLCQEKRWVAWRMEDRNGEQSKVPYAVTPSGGTSKHASSTDPETWATYEEAEAYLERSSMTGLGFVLGDGWCGIDLDHHISSGVLSDAAGRICKAFNSYAEKSPSGTGIHIIARALKPGPRCKEYQDTNPDGTEQAIEIYDNGRYFTMTGNIIEPYCEVNDNATDVLEQLYNEMFPPEEKRGNNDKGLPPQAASVSLDDQEILGLALSSKNSAKFTALWEGDYTGYESRSEADLALSNLLMFWFNHDLSRIDAMFRQSGLMRPKWDRKLGDITYGEKTLKAASLGVTDSYKPSDNGAKRQGFDPNGSKSSHPASKNDTVGGDAEGLDRIKYTDGWRARELIKMHGKDMAWSEEQGQWFIWDGQRFKIDNQNRSLALTRDVTRLVLDWSKASREANDEAQSLYFEQQASRADSLAKYNAMLKLAQSEPDIAITLDMFDADPMLFNVQNGTIDLRTGELLPHRRGDNLTKISPAHYDPQAKCPEWDFFLNRIMASNQRLIAFLQRAIGYSMTAVMRENVLLLMHGTGANGKTVCVETLTRMFGDYARNSPENLLIKQSFGDKHPAGLASLMGARLVFSPELDKDDKLDEGLVKRITGGDTLTARFMGQNFFDFKPSHTIWATANELPEISGTDKGIWRRIRKIPFTVEIPEEEQRPLDEMLAMFESERSGILRWAVEGCLAWQKDGLAEPEEITTATEEYQADSDIVQRFLEDRTINEPLGEIKASNLFGAFRRWCEINGELSMNQNRFGRRITTKGFERERQNTGFFYQGLMFREDI